MTIFDRLDRVASRTVDRVNAIEFRLTPMVRPSNARPAPDPDREVVNGKGIFDYQAEGSGLELGVRKTYREGNDLRNLMIAKKPFLSVDRSYFPSLDDEPRQGDKIEFPNRTELPPFDVVSTERDDLSRLVITLVHQGHQT